MAPLHAKLKSRLQQRYFEDSQDAERVAVEDSSNNKSITGNGNIHSNNDSRSPVLNGNDNRNGDVGQHSKEVLEIDSRNLDLLARAANLHTASVPQKHQIEEDRQLQEWEEREITKHFCGDRKMGIQDLKNNNGTNEMYVLTRLNTSHHSGVDPGIEHIHVSRAASLNGGDTHISTPHAFMNGHQERVDHSQENRLSTTVEGRTTLLEQELLKSDPDLDRRALILIEEYQKGNHAARKFVALTQGLTNGGQTTEFEPATNEEKCVFVRRPDLSNSSSCESLNDRHPTVKTSDSHILYMNTHRNHNVVMNGENDVNGKQLNYHQIQQYHQNALDSRQNPLIHNETHEYVHQNGQYRLHSDHVSVAHLPGSRQQSHSSPLPVRIVPSQQEFNNHQQTPHRGMTNHQQIPHQDIKTHQQTHHQGNIKRQLSPQISSRPRVHQNNSRMTDIIVEQLQKAPISPSNNVPFINRIMSEDKEPRDQRRLRHAAPPGIKGSIQRTLVTNPMYPHLTPIVQQTTVQRNESLGQAERLLRSQTELNNVTSQTMTVNVPAFLPSHPSLVQALSVKPPTPPHLRHPNDKVAASHDIQFNDIPKDLSLDTRKINYPYNSEPQSVRGSHIVYGLGGQSILVNPVNHKDNNSFRSILLNSSPSQTASIFSTAMLKSMPDFDSKILADKRRMIAMARCTEARNKEHQRHRDYT